MTLPASGIITVRDVNTEIGGTLPTGLVEGGEALGFQTPFSLTDLYGKTAPSGPTISTLVISDPSINEVSQRIDVTVTTTGSQYDGYQLTLTCTIYQDSYANVIAEEFLVYSANIGGAGTQYFIDNLELQAPIFPDPIDPADGWSGVIFEITGYFNVTSGTEATDEFISSQSPVTTT